MSKPVNCYIMVYTHAVGYNGFVSHYPAPQWYILGSETDDGFLVWSQEKDFKLGDQGCGKYIYNVKDLGLDAKTCLTYYDQFEQLKNAEHDNYDWNTMRPCTTPTTTRIQAYLDSVKPTIDNAVNERHDAWTRRHHIIALFADPSRY